jgi:hypothetical protein
MIFHQEIDPFAKKNLNSKFAKFSWCVPRGGKQPSQKYTRIIFLNKNYRKGFLIGKKDPNLPDFEKKKKKI